MDGQQGQGRSAHGPGGDEETFKPTSGRVSGVLGLAGAALVVVLVLAEGVDLAVAAAALLVGVLIWAAVLRPGLALRGESLEMRNMLETVTIPLAAIEEVRVLQFTSVRAGGRRFVSPAVSRTMRQIRQDAKDPLTIGGSYAGYVQSRIIDRAAEVRAAHGIVPESAQQAALAEQVHREPARAEISLIVATAALLLLALLF